MNPAETVEVGSPAEQRVGNRNPQDEHNEHAGSYTESPKNTLGTSPHVSSETARRDHHEDSSFGMMDSSFDTLSDAGGTFGMGSDDFILTPSNHGRILQTSSARGAGIVNISSPELKLQQDLESSELSVGDISPIKLVYTSSTSVHEARNEPRQDAFMSPSMYAFAPTPFQADTQNDTSVIPADWRQDAGYFNPYGRRSNPFFVLRSSRKAFENVKYLLSCLRSSIEACTVNMSDHGSIRQYKEKKDNGDFSFDLTIATRRVEAAICAFGGTLNSTRNQQTRSIFRHRGASTDARRLYEQHLPGRYHQSGSRISWDVEENPPIHFTQEEVHFEVQMPRQMNSGTEDLHRKYTDDGNSSTTSESLTNQTADDTLSDATKMKYKCKMCGQLKQNHNCPYQQPLQRSIGVMVYPAVNSYTAAEPGVIAPPLTKMNNFVSYDSDQGSPQPETSRHTGGNLFAVHPINVTPDTLRGGSFFRSPQSSLSAPSSEDPIASSSTGQPMHGAKVDARGFKRAHAQLSEHRSSPFVASVTLRPEQYRAVTPSTKETTKAEQGAPTTTSTAYQYPAIPLTFAERKRMSDTLFYLSNEIPSMTSDCAAALRDARQNNEWDLAVAELLTQVVVGLYCGEGDVRLEGLQQYLLALGISC